MGQRARARVLPRQRPGGRPPARPAREESGPRRPAARAIGSRSKTRRRADVSGPDGTGPVGGRRAKGLIWWPNSRFGVTHPGDIRGSLAIVKVGPENV